MPQCRAAAATLPKAAFLSGLPVLETPTIRGPWEALMEGGLGGG